MTDRYSTTHPEGQYQPGSNNTVLLNKRGIITVDEMDNVEFDLLGEMQDKLLGELEIDQRITAQDIATWHRHWLGSVYEWAGEYRSVNMAKGDFIFAAAHLIPKLMTDFEKKFLAQYTPCHEMNRDQLIAALALCHIELIIIHPFRDGNGRLARVLATIMALQANMPPLDFELLEKQKERYITAIHAGHAGDYEPMKKIFAEVLDYSLKQVSRNEQSDSE